MKKYNIEYSKEAKQDLIGIKKYIKYNLQEPEIVKIYKFQICFFLYSFPHFTIESNIGFRLNPVSVKEYYTRGGTSA